jgi:hypothetical protein
VYEKRVLRKIFGPKRDEVTGHWRKLRNQEHNDLYCLPCSTEVIKSRRMRWARHVACMGRRDVHIGCWWGNVRETDHLEDPGVDGKIIL